MGTRRSESSNTVTPAIKVIGFHVEGVAASPAQTIPLLADNHGPTSGAAGSPQPVIIPPSFQKQESPLLKTRSDIAALVNVNKADKQPALSSSATSLPGSDLQDLLSAVEASGSAVAEASKSAREPPSPSFTRIQGFPTGLPAPLPLLSPPAIVPSATAPQTAVIPVSPRPPPSPKVAEPAKEAASGLTGTRSATSAHSQAPEQSQSHPQRDEKPQSSARSSETGASGTSTAEPPRPASGSEALSASSKGKKEAQRPPVDKADKPKLSRAERRAVQEQQRADKAAAKAAEQGEGGGGQAAAAGSAVGPASVGGRQGGESSSAGQAREAAAGHQRAAKPSKRAQEAHVSTRSTELFAHLQQYKPVTIQSALEDIPEARLVHPAVLQLGLKYADGTIRGSNARCIAMLDAFRLLIEDYRTPEGKVLHRDLQNVLNTAIQFLVHCRPLSVSMGNAIRFLKLEVGRLGEAKDALADEDAKALIVSRIENYVQEKILVADDVLIASAVSKLMDDDVILTYAVSSIVFSVLLKAKQMGRRFRVVVADSRPQLEGRDLLQRLLQAGIPCTYVYINALSYIMQEVTKVLLGASAVLSNGTVISRVGSAAVAMVAHNSDVPVMVCCETYKFHEKVQLDSITSNELGDPNALVSVAGRPDITALKGWEDMPNLALLNLTYDATPAEYVSVIITEFGAIPTTSVPVILREYRQEPPL